MTEGDQPAEGERVDTASPTDSEDPVDDVDSAFDVDAIAQNQIKPDLESAVKRNSATFDQLTEAYYYSQPTYNDDKVDCAVYGRYVDPLYRAFEAAEGAATYYYGSDIIAGTALTVKDHGRRFGIFSRRRLFTLHFVNNERAGADRDLLDLCGELERLAVAVRGQLKDQELDVCMKQLFGTTTNVFSTLEQRVVGRRSGASSDDAPLVDLYKADLRRTQDLYEESAQRTAQIVYFGGMVIGAVLLALIAWFLSFGDVEHLGRDFFTTVAAGGVGAVVSVMSRMTAGKLVLRHRVGDLLIRFFGAFRPFIGATFGVILYFAIVAGIIPLEVPTDEKAQMFFFAVIGFLAGFSERWAQDMLTVTQENLSVTGAPQAPAAQGSSELRHDRASGDGARSDRG